MRTYAQIKKAQAKLDKELEKIRANCEHDKHGPDDGFNGFYRSDNEPYSVKFCKGCGKNWGKIQSEKSW